MSSRWLLVEEQSRLGKNFRSAQLLFTVIDSKIKFILEISFVHLLLFFLLDRLLNNFLRNGSGHFQIYKWIQINFAMILDLRLSVNE